MAEAGNAPLETTASFGSVSSEKGDTHSVITGSADGGGELLPGSAEKGDAPARSVSECTSHGSWACAFDPVGAKEEGAPMGDGREPEEADVVVSGPVTLSGKPLPNARDHGASVLPCAESPTCVVPGTPSEGPLVGSSVAGGRSGTASGSAPSRGGSMGQPSSGNHRVGSRCSSLGGSKGEGPCWGSTVAGGGSGTASAVASSHGESEGHPSSGNPRVGVTLLVSGRVQCGRLRARRGSSARHSWLSMSKSFKSNSRVVGYLLLIMDMIRLMAWSRQNNSKSVSTGVLAVTSYLISGDLN